METMKVLLCVAVIVAACIETSSAAINCPPPSTIYDYTKRDSCKTDKDCRNGMVCCPNPARTMSCTIAISNGGRPDKYNSGGAGANKCEGVTCQPYEVCKPDPNNRNRKKCQRP